MIDILLFDPNKVSPDNAREAFKQAVETFKDDDVLCIPYGMSWIQDYPVSELKNFRDYLTALIDRTEVLQNNDL